jgi:hypothetical protein
VWSCRAALYSTTPTASCTVDARQVAPLLLVAPTNSFRQLAPTAATVCVAATYRRAARIPVSCSGGSGFKSQSEGFSWGFLISFRNSQTSRQEQPVTGRPAGKPKSRWEDDIRNDMRRMLIVKWTEHVQDQGQNSPRVVVHNKKKKKPTSASFPVLSNS